MRHFMSRFIERLMSVAGALKQAGTHVTKENIRLQGKLLHV
ncbi:hypothetical protein GP5015_848 [gamma proteobacterium HTCC5015]|nr:hypothetical protein GP5015_848 [gamma proteobacterium HTCC5015]